MASITYDRITKRYPDGTLAVAELDLEIRDGEFLVLVGPSGCGKTTALRMAAGLEEISDGRLLVGDRVVNNVHPAERDIAMVFQNYALYPHMTVRENMAFPLNCAGVPKAEATSRVERAAEALGLTEYLHRKPKALSGGQRQRVAMGRAIVRQPQAFLMDEPLSNLDAKLRGQMRAEIRALQREYATTTLYVTHDQIEAMTMGDRIAVLRKGLLQQLGTPDELYSNPANLFVAEFIGSPPMNIVRAIVTRSPAGPQLVVGSQRLQLAEGALDAFPALAGADATPVALGLRPESL
jgi:multiple sugar transport system ATP-binding protein